MMKRLSCAALAAFLVACGGGEAKPPAPSPRASAPAKASASAPKPAAAAPTAAASAASAEKPAASGAPTPSAAPTASASAAPSASAAAAPAASAAPAIEEPKVVDADGKLLPQTEDEPSIEDPRFKHQLEVLFKAIVADDAEMARPFFFPKPAYEKVKAIKKPGRDWERRLWRLFKRDIHKYHRKLGKFRGDAKLEGIKLRRKVKWMKPGSEGNRIGYYRVTRSHLIYRDHKDRKRTLEITAFISWRGHWYVVHLDGFK